MRISPRARWLAPALALVCLVGLLWFIDEGPAPSDADRHDPHPALSDVPVSVGTVHISKSAYDRIEPGMSYDEVEAIVGGPGHLSSVEENEAVKTEIFTWDGNGRTGSNANVSFEDGRVTTKADYELR